MSSQLGPEAADGRLGRPVRRSRAELTVLAHRPGGAGDFLGAGRMPASCIALLRLAEVVEGERTVRLAWQCFSKLTEARSAFPVQACIYVHADRFRNPIRVGVASKALDPRHPAGSGSRWMSPCTVRAISSRRRSGCRSMRCGWARRANDRPDLARPALPSRPRSKVAAGFARRGRARVARGHVARALPRGHRSSRALRASARPRLPVGGRRR